MIHYKIFLLIIGSSLLLLSCNKSNDTAGESEVVYQNYKALVTEVEKDTVVSEKDLGKSWETRTDSLKQNFAKFKEATALHLDKYEAEKREEVNAFDERLEVAFETRQKKYDNVSYRYSLRKEMLNMEVSEDDMSRIDTSNIAATYRHFVNKVKNNHANYTPKDWQLIEGWWNALENRRQSINNLLQPADQERISKEQEAYKKIKEQVAQIATATSA